MAIMNFFPMGGRKDFTGAVVTLGATLEYNGSVQTQAVSSVVLNGVTLTPNTDYAVVGNTGTDAGSYQLTVLGLGNYSGYVTTPWTINKAPGSISVSPATLNIIGRAGDAGIAAITKTGDGAVTVESSATGVATADISGNNIVLYAVNDGTAIITVRMAAGDNYEAASCTLTANVTLAHIYGVSWDKSSSTTLTRTDDSALFIDPVPAVGTGSGSSPFDNLMPWSGMVKETIGDDVLVKIPKYYFKWTSTSSTLKLQISNAPVDGFHVSPAHADRCDGKGERDYVYVARYHCNGYYKSVTNAYPVASITFSAARNSIQARGEGYYMFDFAMWWTINMLYLVEFADWNSQSKIGYGCGNNDFYEKTGNSDSMTYHTGTKQSSRTYYGVGVQYRWIEDLWANVQDWMDGIYSSGLDIYAHTKPSEYNTSYYTLVSSVSSQLNGAIADFNVPSVSGLEWALFPSVTKSSDYYSTYVTDRAYMLGSGKFTVGGSYGRNTQYGLFYINSQPASNAAYVIGARLQYLP